MTHDQRFHFRQLGVFLCIVVLIVGVFWIERREGNLDKAESRGYPKGAHEEAVARKVGEQFAEHRFERWGPHVVGEEIEKYPAWKKAGAVAIVVRARRITCLTG
jgi:hypothetical protein